MRGYDLGARKLFAGIIVSALVAIAGISSGAVLLRDRESPLGVALLLLGFVSVIAFAAFLCLAAFPNEDL